MSIDAGTVLLLLFTLALASYGIMYIVRCVRRGEKAASAGMIMLLALNAAMLALFWFPWG